MYRPGYHIEETAGIGSLLFLLYLQGLVSLADKRDEGVGPAGSNASVVDRQGFRENRTKNQLPVLQASLLVDISESSEKIAS